MKLYTIAIMDQETRKIVDTYRDVQENDLMDRSIYLPDIIRWLRKFIKEDTK